VRKSVNDDVPAVRKKAGSCPDGSRSAATVVLSSVVVAAAYPCGATTNQPPPRWGLLATLLDVSADELLRVLLQYRVDFVEEVVHVLGQLLLVLGRLGARPRGRRLVDLLVPAGLAGLGLAACVAGRHAGGPPRVPGASLLAGSMSRSLDGTRPA